MPLKHYLDHYDDSVSVSGVPEAKESDLTPRAYAEYGYIPMFMSEQGVMFDACLTIQKEAFIYDIFCRVFDLYGEVCPYAQEDFSVEQYTAGEEVKISVIGLPTKNLQKEDILKMVYVMDGEHVKFHFLAVRQDAEGPYIYYFNLETCDWEAEAFAPADTEELLKLVFDILDQKQPLYPRCITGHCPICGAEVKLGVTEEEVEGFRQFQEEDADLEEVLPDFGPFEREFLLTGMCPNCQCNVFHTKPPEDMSRWDIA